MKIIGLMMFYDEQPADFTRALASLAGICEDVIVMDGAFLQWPGGQPFSPPEQVEALVEECARLGLVLHYEQPDHPWHDEVLKRNAMIDKARGLGTVWADWILWLDADEEIVRFGNAPALLENTRWKVAEITRDGVSQFQGDREAGIEQPYVSRSTLMGLTPTLRVEGGHGCYRDDEEWLLNSSCLAPALDLTQEVLLHHWHRHTSEERERARQAFYGAPGRL